MALLLDTQIIIWIEQAPQNLTPLSIRKIADEADVFFSMASVWEIAIKLKTAKLTLQQSLPEFVKSFQSSYRFGLMDITLPFIYHTQQLPLHHRDPFDRLLIAQALTENIPVISSDAVWDAYGVQRIWQ